MTTAFDSIAATYDTIWTESAIGRAQRDQIWRRIDAIFHAGDLVLDLGCGTGEDAVHLSRRGVHVRGIDASAGMVAAARLRGIAAEQLAVEEMRSLDASFDGALSNFGALNCVRDLRGAAMSLASLIRPSGFAALCLMNRTCAWELVYHGVRGHFRKALRRLSPDGVETSLGLRVWYPTTREVRAAFAPEFDLTATHGIGLFVPPSYVNLPRWAVRAAAAADSFCPSTHCVPSDHTLYIFRRRNAC